MNIRYYCIHPFLPIASASIKYTDHFLIKSALCISKFCIHSLQLVEIHDVEHADREGQLNNLCIQSVRVPGTNPLRISRNNCVYNSLNYISLVFIFSAKVRTREIQPLCLLNLKVDMTHENCVNHFFF